MDDEVQYNEGPYCSVCDGLGHSAGEFGELCPSVNPRGWFDPSDPYEYEDRF